MNAENEGRKTTARPHCCILTIAWILGFGCGVAGLQMLQNCFFPLPQPMPEELRMDMEHMFAMLFVFFCCGFLGVWFTWRIWKYL